MAKRSGLGKGLDALITNTDTSTPPPTTKAEAGVQEVAPEKIVRNPHQPRLHFNQEELDELTASIEEHGVIQPLIVSANGDGTYTLIAGERRLRASKQAELKRVPVVIKQVTAQQQLEWALIENVQRADLSPLEEAEAYLQLNEDFGLSHQKIAKQVGKSRVTVTNTMRLLKLADGVKVALLDKLITEGHARALLSLASDEAQEAALQTVISVQLNVRQTEQLVNKLNGEKPAPKAAISKAPEVLDIENQLASRFETKVSMRHSGKGGSITLHYASDEDLDALLGKLL